MPRLFVRLALVCAALSSVAARPNVLLTFPDPRAELPDALAFFHGATAKSPRVSALKQELRRLGLDPTTAQTLEKLGLDLGQPAYLWLATGSGAAALELAVSHADLWDRELAALEKRGRPAERTSEGLCMTRPKVRLGLARRGERAFLELLPPRLSCGSLMESAAAMSRPRRPPEIELGGSPPSFWIEGDGEGGVERLVGVGLLEAKRLHLRTRLGLDMAGALILGGNPLLPRGRALIQGPGQPALDLGLHLGRALQASLFELLGLPESLVGQLGGDLQLVLGPKGGMALALEPRADLPEAERQVAEQALRGLAPKVERRGGVFLASWPGKDPGFVSALKPAAAAERRPLLLEVNPPAVFAAVERVVKAQPQLEVSPRELAEAKQELEPVLSRFAAARLEGWVEGGAPELSFELRLK